MLCQNCKRRSRCVEPCPRLAADLRRQEGALQELTFSPNSAARAADLALLTLADLQPDQPWPWENLTRAFPALSSTHVELFLSRFYDHRPVREIAAERGLHRVTVSRRLREAVNMIREAREQGAARVEGRHERINA